MTPQDAQAFEQLLANCADEPIRSPGAIQPHGVLPVSYTHLTLPTNREV